MNGHDVTPKRVAAVAAAVASAAMISPGSGGADPIQSITEDPDGGHCVLEVTGQKASGEYLTAAPRCFGTLAEALATAGVDIDPSNASLSMREVTRSDLLAAASTLAIHYDGFNWTGASITVSGAECNGGYINLSQSWINRISSNRDQLCQNVYFFSGYDKTGSSETTNVNLSALNDASRSVMYL